MVGVVVLCVKTRTAPAQEQIRSAELVNFTFSIIFEVREEKAHQREDTLKDQIRHLMLRLKVLWER